MAQHLDTYAKASFQEAFFISPDTYIHPTAIVDTTVQLGSGVKIGPHAIVTGNVTIGNNTIIYPYASIGLPAQVIGIKKSLGSITIGQECQFREFSTVHASRTAEGFTTIGDFCYLMNYAHVGHDATLEHHVTLTNNAMLAGHTYVEHHALIMAAAATHQFTRIGSYSALAPFSGIRQDLPPFGIYTGKPAQFSGLNLIGLRRAGFNAQNIQNIKRITSAFYQNKKLTTQLKELIAAEDTLRNDPLVQQFVSFIESSNRGVSRSSLNDAHEEVKVF